MRITLAIAFLLIFAACKDKTKLVINGQINNAAPGKQMVRLLTQTANGDILVLDSAVLGENKDFKLQALATQATFYQIAYNSHNYMLIAQNGDEIDFILDDNKPNTYTVTGCPEADKIVAFNNIISAYADKSEAIEQKYSRMLQQNPTQKNNIIQQYQNQTSLNLQPFLAKTYQFIKTNTQSLTAFYAANTLQSLDENGAYEKQIIAYAQSIKTKFNNTQVQNFVTQMDVVARVSIGKIAPDIIAETPDSKTIQLSSLKGKYVLLDFWASWCGPCRQENPFVVAAFNKFKNKNFTVFSFSLDDDKTNWVKAIKDDKLNWAHASDFKGFNSPFALTYNVNAIPHCILLNPEGKIIAKNLTGNNLTNYLTKTLK